MSTSRNLTLRVDEDTLAIVRRYATDRGTTVNALVRELFAELADREDRAAAARARLVEMSRGSRARIGALPEREDLHDR